MTTMENKYSMLQQAAVLMALDTGGTIVETVLTFVLSILDSANADGALFPMEAVSHANIYISWTIWGLRLLIWLLTVVLLSHMTDLRKSFGSARIWYFLRILTFIVVMMLVNAVTYLRYEHLSDPDAEILFFFGRMILFTLGLNFLLEGLLLSIGNRSILAAGAELLESFGLKKPAQENRRCGNGLIGFTAAYAILLLFGCALLFVLLSWNELPLFNALETGDAQGVLVLLVIAAFLLCFVTWLGMEICRILAPIRMNRTYRAIRELSK